MIDLWNVSFVYFIPIQIEYQCMIYEIIMYRMELIKIKITKQCVYVFVLGIGGWVDVCLCVLANGHHLFRKFRKRKHIL